MLSAETTVEKRGVGLFSRIHEMTCFILPSARACSLILTRLFILVRISCWCLAWQSFLHLLRFVLINVRSCSWVDAGVRSIVGYVGNILVIISENLGICLVSMILVSE